MQTPNFTNARVLVAGDLMLDRYWDGSTARISPEAPVPVVSVTSTSHTLGGAGNVFHNITTLGGKACVCGVVGEDQPGQRLHEALFGFYSVSCTAADQ